jgi:hypothetical protein
MLRDESRDLYAGFVQLLPSPPQPIRIQRWSARRVGLWALVVVLLVVAGGTIASSLNRDIATKTPLNINNLDCSQPEPLWLMAQSVPSAALVPCLQLLPVGWTVAEVAVNNGRSLITLDHDRAGRGAVVVELAASCDLAGADEVTSEQPGARRYLRIDHNAPGFSATRSYDFPGAASPNSSPHQPAADSS